LHFESEEVFEEEAIENSNGKKAMSKISKGSPAKRYQMGSQLSEIICVLGFSVGVALLWHGFMVKPLSTLEGVAGTLLIGVAVALFFLAVRFATKLDNETGLRYLNSTYLISEFRVATLREVHAPRDVTDFLDSMSDPANSMTQAQLLHALRAALGPVRTREIRDIVLKYTRVEKE